MRLVTLVTILWFCCCCCPSSFCHAKNNIHDADLTDSTPTTPSRSTTTTTSSSSHKVNIVLLTEAGCPPCEQLITETLNDLVVNADNGIAAIVTINQYSWGNAYIGIDRCLSSATGSSSSSAFIRGAAQHRNHQTKSVQSLTEDDHHEQQHEYDSNERHCWASTCLSPAPADPDCFNLSKIVIQHGPKENDYNRMQNCAQMIAGYQEWQPYWQFLVCMENQYMEGGSEDDTVHGKDIDAVTAARTCAHQQQDHYYQFDDLQDCFTSEMGDAAQIAAASQSFDHIGTPTIFVNGQSPDFETHGAKALLMAICDAYDGPGADMPPACAAGVDDSDREDGTILAQS